MARPGGWALLNDRTTSTVGTQYRRASVKCRATRFVRQNCRAAPTPEPSRIPSHADRPRRHCASYPVRGRPGIPADGRGRDAERPPPTAWRASWIARVRLRRAWRASTARPSSCTPIWGARTARALHQLLRSRCAIAAVLVAMVSRDPVRQCLLRAGPGGPHRLPSSSAPCWCSARRLHRLFHRGALRHRRAAHRHPHF